jgi:hypothetical protein
MRAWATILKTGMILLGGAIVVLSCPLLALAFQGFTGDLADVSRAENRMFGLMFLVYGLIPFTLGAGLIVASRLVKIPPAPAGRCPRCGYDLRGNPGRCSECGHDVAPPETREPDVSSRPPSGFDQWRSRDE